MALCRLVTNFFFLSPPREELDLVTNRQGSALSASTGSPLSFCEYNCNRGLGLGANTEWFRLVGYSRGLFELGTIKSGPGSVLQAPAVKGVVCSIPHKSPVVVVVGSLNLGTKSIYS